MIVAFVARVPIHESFHLTVMEGLGGVGDIDYITVLKYIPIGGHVNFVEGYPLPEPLWPVYLAGGVSVAIFFFFPWLFSLITLEKGDTWVEGVSFSIMMTGLLYAPTELVLLHFGRDAHTVAYIIALFATQVIFFVLYTRPLVRWWLGKYLGTSKRKQACFDEVAERNRVKLEKNGKNK